MNMDLSDVQFNCRTVFWNGFQIAEEENAWADFYYFTLPKEAKEKIRNMLSAEELAFLAKLGKKADGVFFPLKEELLHLLVKLNDSEMLFSTVYFTNPKSTWWGNYGRTYIVFREKDHK